MTNVKEPSEHQIQASLISILKYALRPGLEVASIPNGLLRKSAMMKARAEGLRKGAPDLVFALADGRVGWLEMKTRVGSLQPEQKTFRDRVLALGHLWAMARSVQEAMQVLTEWDALLPAYRVTDDEAANPYADYYGIAA